MRECIEGAKMAPGIMIGEQRTGVLVNQDGKALTATVFLRGGSC